MSYCRTGDNSDIYTYGTYATEGRKHLWVTHVAYGRIDPQFPMPGGDATPKEHVEWINRPLIPIASHDGETYEDWSEEDCAKRLEWLRDEGYRVPQYAIDRLREEASKEREW